MATPPYDYWLFDLDGTLVDVEWPYVRDVFGRVEDELGCAFTDREAAAIWHGFDGTRNGTLRATGVDPDTFWPTIHHVEDPWERAEATFLHDDAAFIADLDVPVGIVTHCQSFLSDPVLEHLDIRDWFESVIACTPDVGWKPDPRPVEAAKRELDVHRNGAVGVLAGDSVNDVAAAANAGLDSIHVERHGADARGMCVMADYRVRSFDELGFVSRPRNEVPFEDATQD